MVSIFLFSNIQIMGLSILPFLFLYLLPIIFMFISLIIFIYFFWFLFFLFSNIQIMGLLILPFLFLCLLPIIFIFISLIIFNYFFWFLFFSIFEYSNYGFIDITVLKIYEKRKDTRERLGLVRTARNYRFELHRRWMIYDSGYGAAYDSIYRYRPRATLKLASLFASRILGELLIGNTRKWIRCIHRFTR